MMNVDSVLKQQFDKVHSVQHQSIHHRLLQRVHLQEDLSKPICPFKRPLNEL